ncbi:DUF6531 domain-containing protein [Peribacillus butanolivorans]|uniref:DUF6531 domain-containing protein n=1 Tax=Peribacillus butanolivorans TaxID=421767 RepID=UPI00380CAA57
MLLKWSLQVNLTAFIGWCKSCKWKLNDLTIPGRGIPVSMTRTYNNRKSHVTGMFGYGWTSNVEKRLVDGGTGPITLIDEDNTRHIF